MDNAGGVTEKATRLVTAESVAAACDTLVTQGKKPSFRSIIEVLGGGSPNDIQPFFSQWKAKQAEATAAVPIAEPPALPRIAEEMPEIADLLEPLAGGLMKMVSGMLDRQRVEFEGKLATVQEGAESRVAQAKYDAEAEIRRVKAELAAEAEEWQTAEASILEERLSLLDRVAELEAANASLVTEVAEATGKATEAEENLSLARRSLDYTSLERDEARRTAAAEAEKVTRLEAEKASLLGLIESLRAEVVTERERTDRLHQRIETLVGRLARMEENGDEEKAGPRPR